MNEGVTIISNFEVQITNYSGQNYISKEKKIRVNGEKKFKAKENRKKGDTKINAYL